MNLDTIALVPWARRLSCGLFLLNRLIYRPPVIRNIENPSNWVSVLIPARNEERTSARPSETVLANRGVDFEVIVLDDHSTDRTAGNRRRTRASDERLRLESAPPLPSGGAVNNTPAMFLPDSLAIRSCLHGCRRALAPDALGRMVVFMEQTALRSPAAFRARNSARSPNGC